MARLFFKSTESPLQFGGDCWALPVLEWVEIEPSKEEEDANAVVLKGAEAARGRLDGLDGGVEGFGGGVGDAVLKMAQQTMGVVLKCFSRFLDGFQAAAPRLVIPLGKEALGAGDVGCLPELQE